MGTEKGHDLIKGVNHVGPGPAMTFGWIKHILIGDSRSLQLIPEHHRLSRCYHNICSAMEDDGGRALGSDKTHGTRLLVKRGMGGGIAAGYLYQQ